MTCKLFPVLWSIILGITFLCCSLLIFNAFINQKKTCYPQSVCYSSAKLKAEKLEDEKCRSVCSTKECIEVSTYILSNMDPSVDPCEDFYDFACGNYAEKLKKGGNHSALENLKDDLFRILRDVIETSGETKFAGTAAQKLKIVYDSCMNTASSETTTIRSIQDFLGHMGVPNWPFLSSNFTFLNPTLEESLGKLASYEENVFVLFYPSDEEIFSGQLNGYSYNFSVSPQFQTYHADSEIPKLHEIVTGILLTTGMDFNSINQTWQDFIDVDSAVVSLYRDNSEVSASCEEENATAGSYFECSHDRPNENMLCKLLDAVVRNGRITSRFSRDRVYIKCDYRYYIERIFNLLNRYNHRALAHYMALRVFINNLKHMNFSVRQKLMYSIPYDRDEPVAELDKWKFCISWLAKYMKYPLGIVYVPDIWPKDAQDELNNIVNEYINTTSMFVQNQDWIEDTVRAQLVKEVEDEENFINRIIELYRNKTKINAIYRRFHPSRSNFIRNVLNHNKFHFISSKLNPQDDLIFREFPPFEVNAYGGDNIYLTFGILLPPVFRYGYPKLFNLAKLGQIVGHEIGHKLHYFLGRSLELDNTTRQNFDRREKCLIDQYFDFELKNLGINLQGNQTIAENFPDNMAVKVTEKIAKNLLENMTESMFALPGLPYSPEELLYISYAQTWCEVRSIEKEKEHYERDTHSPPEFRIMGGLQNSERFSQVFDCPPTSFMNPAKKCPIFD